MLILSCKAGDARKKCAYGWAAARVPIERGRSHSNHDNRCCAAKKSRAILTLMANQQSASSSRHRGTSRAYILQRLADAGRDDLVVAVEAGDISALTAAAHMGWHTRPPTKNGEESAKAKRARFALQRIEGR
jgi:hypothetical protein